MMKNNWEGERERKNIMDGEKALCYAIVFIYVSIWHMMKEFVELLFYSLFFVLLPRLDYVEAAAAIAFFIFKNERRKMLT